MQLLFDRPVIMLLLITHLRAYLLSHSSLRNYVLISYIHRT
jgi:hypothetical protein